MGVSADSGKAITNRATVTDEGQKPHHGPSNSFKSSGVVGPNRQVDRFQDYSAEDQSRQIMAGQPRRPRRSRRDSAGSATPESPDGTLAQVAGMRAWGSAWGLFQSDWRGWLGLVDAAAPAYCLPDTVIEGLGLPDPVRPTNRRVFLSADEADAEFAFTALCREFSSQCVGVWLERPINFPLLSSAAAAPPIIIPADLTARWAASTGRSEQLLSNQVDDLVANLHRTNQQLLGFCGWLLTNDGFQQELHDLRDLWRPSDNHGSGIGLFRPAMVDAAGRRPGTRRLSGRKARFCGALDNLCSKWSLAGLATWDLPLPLGPLESVPAALIARLRGPDATVDHFPPFYDIPSDVDLREQVRDRQMVDGELQGIPDLPVTNTSPRAGHLSGLANLLRVWLIENAVYQRYGKPRGIVSRIVDGMAEHLGVGSDRAWQLHKRCCGLRRLR